MTEFPEPLVPSSCDLNSFPEMPIEINRLRRSAAWRLARRKPELGYYMINLWLASWHEVPAGSLEDNDDALSDLAMCAPKRWPQVKQEVLHGWVKCSDGRLYHPVVAEKANGALQRKRTQSQRGSAGAAARWGKHSASDASGMLTPCHKHSESMQSDGQERLERNDKNDERGTRVRAQGSLSEDFEISDEWITAAAVARESADMPPVNLKAEAAKRLVKWRLHPPEHAFEEWMDWALKARADPSNGTATPGPDPPERVSPSGPPPPFPH